MKRRFGRTGPAAMLAVCLALGTVVYDAIERGPESAQVSVDAVPEKIAPLAQRTAPRAKPIKAYSETLRRPLFHPSRKPAPKLAAASPEAPAAESPVLRLIGVVIAPEGRSALIRMPNLADLVEVSVGERINGWRLERIETDRIVLKSGKESAVYRIDAELR